MSQSSQNQPPFVDPEGNEDDPYGRKIREAAIRLGVVGGRNPDDERSLDLTLAQLCANCIVSTIEAAGRHPDLLWEPKRAAAWGVQWLVAALERYQVPEGLWQQGVGKMPREDVVKIQQGQMPMGTPIEIQVDNG